MVAPRKLPPPDPNPDLLALVAELRAVDHRWEYIGLYQNL